VSDRRHPQDVGTRLGDVLLADRRRLAGRQVERLASVRQSVGAELRGPVAVPPMAGAQTGRGDRRGGQGADQRGAEDAQRQQEGGPKSSSWGPRGGVRGCPGTTMTGGAGVPTPRLLGLDHDGAGRSGEGAGEAVERRTPPSRSGGGGVFPGAR